MPYKNIVIKGNSITRTPDVLKKGNFYKGFSTVNTKNSGNKLYDFELIKQDLINYFNTRPGERVMNPTFGSNIWSLLFEPLGDTTRQLIQDDILKICNSDPRIYPTDIDIREYAQGYLIELTLITKNSDQSFNLSLSFDQQLGLTAQ
jgi:phage baseplate assembly protein W